jgi:hypothetical protein
MASRNGQKTTRESTITKRPQPNGRGALNSGGTPGNKGGGRKPNAFVEKCEQLADSVVLEKVGRKLRTADPDDPTWRWCAEYVSKYSKTEAPKRVVPEDGEGGPARFTLTIGHLSAA